MRLFWERVSSLRFFLVVAASATVTLAASSPIHSAEVGGAARADCSEATARQLVEEHRLNHFGLPNPVSQVLCGPFTGRKQRSDGDHDRRTHLLGDPVLGGLQLHRAAYGSLCSTEPNSSSPLVAVGADIRETTRRIPCGRLPRASRAVARSARIWHWDGSRLVAGPGSRSRKGEPKRRGSIRRARTSIAG